MNVNVNLEGYVEKIVNDAVRKGLAKTKAEAIRQGLLHYGKEYNLGQDEVSLEEVLLVNKKIAQEIDNVDRNNIKGKSLDELKKKYDYN